MLKSIAQKIQSTTHGGDGNEQAELINPKALLEQLMTPEKIALLSGEDGWHTVGIPRLGIPRVRVSLSPVTDYCSRLTFDSAAMDL